MTTRECGSNDRDNAIVSGSRAAPLLLVAITLDEVVEGHGFVGRSRREASVAERDSSRGRVRVPPHRRGPIRIREACSSKLRSLGVPATGVVTDLRRFSRGADPLRGWSSPSTAGNPLRIGIVMIFGARIPWCQGISSVSTSRRTRSPRDWREWTRSTRSPRLETIPRRCDEAQSVEFDRRGGAMFASALYATSGVERSLHAARVDRRALRRRRGRRGVVWTAVPFLAADVIRRRNSFRARVGNGGIAQITALDSVVPMTRSTGGRAFRIFCRIFP